MGCAASIDRAELLRRERALAYSEASSFGLLVRTQQQPDPVPAGRWRGFKVAPEPREADEPAPALGMAGQAGSPSFRFYIQKTAEIDALVAAVDADREGSTRGTAETPPAISKNDPQATSKNDHPTTRKADLARNTSKVFKSKVVGAWLKIRGLAFVTSTMSSLFRRHSKPDSTPAHSEKSSHHSASSPRASATSLH